MAEAAAPDGGFFLLWRKFFENRYWTEKRTFSRAEAWIDCVRMAAFEEHKRLVGGVTVQLARGEFIASDRFLERRWRWSRGKVRRFLAMALGAGELRREREMNGGCAEIGTSGGTIYLVANYEVYQPRGTSNSTSDGPPTVPATDQRETSKSNVIPLSPLARAIAEFCDHNGTPWRLGADILTWATDLEREKKYASLDLPSEVKRCDEYWQVEQTKGNTIKSPDRAIRNWMNHELEYAAERAKRAAAPASRNGTDGRTQDAANRRVVRHMTQVAQLDLEASTTVIG